MKNFKGRIAVITGGGSGIGQELARQLMAQGCHVAICDVSQANMDETVRLCREHAVDNARLTTHIADVSVESDVLRFRDEVAGQHQTEAVHLLFNNAGITGGGSLIKTSREEWDRTFNVNWGGVYYGTRAFLPMLMKANAGHIISIASVNAMWASIAPDVPHTAYCTAKFVTRGFTEALITDLAVNAPHIKCSIVMPGVVGTGIVSNTLKVHAGSDSPGLGPEAIAFGRKRLGEVGVDTSQMSDDDIRIKLEQRERNYIDSAPMTAEAAAREILDGVKAEQWRILVGEDARKLDELVRADPEAVYGEEFYQRFVEETGWRRFDNAKGKS